MLLLITLWLAGASEAREIGDFPSKNPNVWEKKCPPEMHYCPPDNPRTRPAICPREETKWLKVDEYEPFTEGDHGLGACKATDRVYELEIYPVERKFHFRCDALRFQGREDGNYVFVTVGYEELFKPRPSKYSKLTDRWDCVPYVRSE